MKHDISQLKRTKQERLFSGLLIRWNELFLSEKVVCATILLIPLWWLWGWRNLFITVFIGIFIYEFSRNNCFKLRSPSLTVIGIIGFGIYNLISIYVYMQINNLTLNPNSILSPVDEWIGGGLILWYIQSKNIRIRLEVVAWACSIIVIMMLLMWLFIYFVLHQAEYVPLRSIYGSLTGKGEKFVPGLGNSNYLMPYFPTDTSLPGMVRYVYFFHGPEALALFVGFTCLLALDIKNRFWSLLLFISSFFLLLTSGTRAVWVALPIVMVLRYLLKIGQAAGTWVLCALIAIVSYTTFSLPPVTNLVFNSITNTADATGKFRGDSTQVRAKIYSMTFDAIAESSETLLLFGHVVPGSGVLPGYEPAKVGTHSFILSSLIYRSGLLGTSFFFTYWISLLLWLYKTRTSRPMCLLIFVIFSLTFTTMEIEMTVTPVSLICTMLQDKNYQKIRNEMINSNLTSF